MQFSLQPRLLFIRVKMRDRQLALFCKLDVVLEFQDWFLAIFQHCDLISTPSTSMLDRSFQVALHIQFRFSCQLFLNHLLSKTCTLQKKWCTYYILTSPAPVCFWYRSSSRLHFLDYCMSHFCKLFFPFFIIFINDNQQCFRATDTNQQKSQRNLKEQEKPDKTTICCLVMQPTICLHIFIQHKMHLFLDGEFFIAFIKKSTKKYWNDCHTKRFRAKSCPVIVWVHVQVLHFLISCMH